MTIPGYGDGVAAEEVYFERDVPNTLGGQVLLDGYLYGTNPKGPACAEFVTGKLKWRWFTVPGDPGKPYENDAMKMAAAPTGLTSWTATGNEPESVVTVWVATRAWALIAGTTFAPRNQGTFASVDFTST